ncbi:MAG: hypothetical protein ABI632_08930 [Pseudolysinimonas sp.]
MADREEHLDALASAENRRDTRRAVIITLIAFATVVISSLLVVLVGAHS